ncbi:hypothetical protein SISSUDRAFT_693111 [Sistotremastrum suecicum HHB10207 ss-3]|uniref:G domain-containing protein n=1 Tax=Sistotremastrum suecicum HHB10207 ss-3 TaxID=1314776 RepID=A0A166I5M8_9AGAM|nr:hypothetical protein SISSUDRAFT_693111 [Sistotremastrum suecicum HHB10207 ss-3]
MAPHDREAENQPIYSTIQVKSERVEPTIPFSSVENYAHTTFPSSNLANTTRAIKPEPVDALPTDATAVGPAPLFHQNINAQKPGASAIPKVPSYTVYTNAQDIEYTPENALQNGVGMVQDLATLVKKIELGKGRRAQTWYREIDDLTKQGSPKTMIAVCGATGAGKSSLLNAVLDDNIVPTSGMRACTAVITEISHHKKKTIDADVSFLTLEEWKAELTILLEELTDEDGNVRRSTDLRSEAGVAWHKVHAVHPLMPIEQLAKSNPDEILRRHPAIAKILGTTKRICAPDSKTFAKEIGKYIDSKDQKRNSKDKKDKAQREKDKKKDNEPALWPLIRLVQVRCPAAALSTGAILVDLPGVADANAARSAIARDYMKKCDCIWIAAPITRAVDDKTAKDLLGEAFRTQLMMDGNYDDSCITFIATKTDDISCSEIIRALNLDENEELQAIIDEIDEATIEMSTWTATQAEAQRTVKALDKEVETLRDVIDDHRNHLEALRNGEEYTPVDFEAKNKPKGKKRKSVGSDYGSSPKRRRSDYGSDDSFINDDDDDLSDLDEDKDEDEGDKDMDVDNNDDRSDAGSNNSDGSDSDKDGEAEDDDEVQEIKEVITEETLKEKIKEKEDELKSLKQRLTTAKADRKKANDELANLKKTIAKVQKKKNAFCSLKRSEFSRDVLKEDFRVGLRELDQAAAEQNNPDTFDPSEDLRNYEAIDLPVFTCSSRDYIRLTKQVKGDGEPTCFLDKPDTGVPALQAWCHDLTITSRERAARNFMSRFKVFIEGISSYLQDVEGVNLGDRMALRDLWQSYPDDDESVIVDQSGERLYRMASEEEWFQDIDAMLGGQKPKTKPDGKATGIALRLEQVIDQIVSTTVASLKVKFRDGLEDRCQSGASKAEAAAVETSDAFAASMHWGTYRATLRRRGEWRRDLNAELVNPLTTEIASSWSRVFESDLFADVEKSATRHIQKLLQEVEASAPAGLQDRCKTQGDLAHEETKVVMKKIMAEVKNKMSNEQKEVSRCLSPHVQDQLGDGYDLAMEERGKGSVARQKLVFRNFVDRNRGDIFTDGADLLLGRLDVAAEAVGETLDQSLAELANKVEICMSVLWEIPKDDVQEHLARNQLKDKLVGLKSLVNLWMTAGETRAKSIKDD